MWSCWQRISVPDSKEHVQTRYLSFNLEYFLLGLFMAHCKETMRHKNAVESKSQLFVWRTNTFMIKMVENDQNLWFLSPLKLYMFVWNTAHLFHLIHSLFCPLDWRSIIIKTSCSRYPASIKLPTRWQRNKCLQIPLIQYQHILKLKDQNVLQMIMKQKTEMKWTSTHECVLV